MERVARYRKRRDGGSMPDAAEEISRAAVITHASNIGHSDCVLSPESDRAFAGDQPLAGHCPTLGVFRSTLTFVYAYTMV